MDGQYHTHHTAVWLIGNTRIQIIHYTVHVNLTNIINSLPTGPLYSGHLCISDTFCFSQRCPLYRGSTLSYCRKYFSDAEVKWHPQVCRDGEVINAGDWMKPSVKFMLVQVGTHLWKQLVPKYKACTYAMMNWAQWRSQPPWEHCTHTCNWVGHIIQVFSGLEIYPPFFGSHLEAIWLNWTTCCKAYPYVYGNT